MSNYATEQDLLNAKKDVDHIAAIATSTSNTATDRTGNTKLTMLGAVNSITSFNPRGTWATGTAYALKDLYTSGGVTYVVTLAHTSTSVAADLAAGKVGVFQGLTSTSIGAVNGAEAAIFVDNYAEVSSYSGVATTMYVAGRLTKQDGGHGWIAVDPLDTASSANGGTIWVDAIGRRWKRQGVSSFNPKWWGAIGDGVAIDHTAIQSCIDAVEALPSVLVYPYITKPIHFNAGTYLIDKPLRVKQALKFTGDNSTIKGIGVGYQAATIPLDVGGTEQNKALMIFLNGNKGSITGVTRTGALIGEGITLDCQEYAFPAVYIERMPYSSVNCSVQNSSTNGVEIGTNMWGLNLDNIIVESFTQSAVYFHINAAANGLSIKNPKIWGNFKTGYAAINFADGNECNGVSISGGFLEKIDYGVLAGTTTGPISINGVDFEYCTLNCVRSVGSAADGRRVGPISIRNSFLHSVSGSKVYSSRANITVESCRMFGNQNDFETDNLMVGAITSIRNEFPSGLNIATGSNVIVHTNTGTTNETNNYLSHKSNTFVKNYALKNYQYKDSPFLQSSGLDFESNYVGGATGQYVSRSTWFISEFQFVTNPAALNKTIGVRLSNDSGQNAFNPILDNQTSCGQAGARWSVIYSATGTINTSDDREKTYLDVSEVERAVALELKANMRKFKFNSSILEKGDNARIHFGASAQTVKSIFESKGLNPFDYALLCYDEWEEERDKEGNITLEGGNRYGLRYEELLSFIISAT